MPNRHPLSRRRLAIVVVLLALNLPAVAQGFLAFDNWGTGARRRPILGPGETPGPAGPRYSAGLRGGPSGSPASALEPLGDVQPFSLQNGYWDPAIIAVPSVPAGRPAMLNVQIWDNEDGRIDRFEDARVRVETGTFLSAPLARTLEEARRRSRDDLTAMPLVELPLDPRASPGVPTHLAIIGVSPPAQGLDPCVSPPQRLLGLSPDGSRITLSIWKPAPGDGCPGFFEEVRTVDSLGNILSNAAPASTLPPDLEQPAPESWSSLVGTPISRRDQGRVLWGTRGAVVLAHRSAHPFTSLLDRASLDVLKRCEDFRIQHVSEDGRTVAGSAIRILHRTPTPYEHSLLFVARLAFPGDLSRLEWTPAPPDGWAVRFRAHAGVEYQVTLAGPLPGSATDPVARFQGDGGIREYILRNSPFRATFLVLEARPVDGVAFTVIGPGALPP